MLLSISIKRSINKKRQIWVIARHFYPIPTGAAIQIQRLLSKITGDNYDARVLTSALREAAYLRGRELKHDGVTIRYLTAIPRINWGRLHKYHLFSFILRGLNHFNFILTKLSFALSCAWHLTIYSRSGDILLLVSSDPFWFIPAWIARLRDLPIVIRMTMLGGDDPETHRRKVHQWQLLHFGNIVTYRLADATIALSSVLEDAYRLSGQDWDKLVHIPVGVDTHLFHPINQTERGALRQALALETDRRYILFVGFPTPRKGIDILLRAFIWIAKRTDDVDLLLAGQYSFSFDQPGDPLNSERILLELRNELKVGSVETRVHWLGHVDNVEQYYQVADVFCFPSRQEGLPNAVAEAMASGLPIVASRLEGITTDLITDGVEGFLLADEQPEAYADALLRLLNNPELAQLLSAAARKRAEAQFDLDAVAQQYIRLFAELSNPRPG